MRINTPDLHDCALSAINNACSMHVKHSLNKEHKHWFMWISKQGVMTHQQMIMVLDSWLKTGQQRWLNAIQHVMIKRTCNLIFGKPYIWISYPRVWRDIPLMSDLIWAELDWNQGCASHRHGEHLKSSNNRCLEGSLLQNPCSFTSPVRNR